jgi:hypothetical protein
MNMQEAGWGPWITWEGGEPPVPEGTLVEAMTMVRAEDLARAAPPFFKHVLFRVQNGDSFRLKPIMNTPRECVLLVYRYRVWGDATSIHGGMPAEIAADRQPALVSLPSNQPAELIAVLASVYGVAARETDWGVEVTDSDAHPDLASWVSIDWPELLHRSRFLDLDDGSAALRLLTGDA